MSEAAKKHRELFGEFNAEFIDDPKACGMGAYAVGNYDYIKERVAKDGIFNIQYGVDMDFEFDVNTHNVPKKKIPIITFRGEDYDANFIDAIVKCLGPVKRIEEWFLEMSVKDVTKFTHALALIDARGDCGVLAYREDPPTRLPETNEELSELVEEILRDLDKKDIPEDDDDDYYIIGDIEELGSNTFDPFDW